MREIKFRAWDTKSKCWVKLYISDNALDLQRGLPNYIILQQYTGLKDKNEEEIYEDDIIRTSSDPNDWNKSTDGIHKVEFWNGQFVFNAMREKDDDYINFGWWVRSNDGDNILHQIEVIGNIYENPELLKESSDASKHQSL